MKLSSWACIGLLLLSVNNLFAQDSATSYPSFNEEMALSIGSDSIALYALIASGKEPKETVILLHGFPGNERNLDLAQDLRTDGKNVVFFSYRGSWGSQGVYSYGNCLEDISAVLNHFSTPSNADKFNIDTSNFTLIGHSFGGGLALISGALDPRVKSVIALSSTNVGHGLRNITSVDSMKVFQNYVRTSFMLNCNPREFVQEMIDNKIRYDVLQYSEALNSKNVLLIDDFDRSEDWPGSLSGLVDYKVISSDHSFTNKREELSKSIIDWLGTD